MRNFFRWKTVALNVWANSVIVKKLPIEKNPPNRRKIAQYGHPDWLDGCLRDTKNVPFLPIFSKRKNGKNVLKTEKKFSIYFWNSFKLAFGVNVFELTYVCTYVIIRFFQSLLWAGSEPAIFPIFRSVSHHWAIPQFFLPKWRRSRLEKCHRQNYDWAGMPNESGIIKTRGPTPSTEVNSRGCQIFLGTWYQNRKNVPNQHKMYPMVIKYPKCV
jgi:hypothetical protein